MGEKEEREIWRRYWQVLGWDEEAGIAATNDERRQLMAMLRSPSGNVFWRCTAKAEAALDPKG